MSINGKRNNNDDNYLENLKNNLQSFNLKLRDRSRSKIKPLKKNELHYPISSWIKEDRLYNKIGYEFVIILRTCACSWARSEAGGCTMCGYFNDRGPEDITQNEILLQFENAMIRNAKKIQEISQSEPNISLKIFTSGSFLDDNEIESETRKQIFNKISEYTEISEVIIESRAEYTKKKKILELKEIIKDKNLIIALGLESSNKFIREYIINKGNSIDQYKNAINEIHEAHSLAKVYLMLKPPLLTEKIAIIDAKRSMKDAIELGSDIISLNPGNVQSYTTGDYLYNRRNYRPPWIYSCIEVFNSVLTKEVLKKVVVVCDPSSKGKDKGIHNCKSKNCNNLWLNILKQFVLTQNIEIIDPKRLPYTSCNCWSQYNLFLDFASI